MLIKSLDKSLLNFTAIKKRFFKLSLYFFTAITSVCLLNSGLYAQQYYFKHYSIEDGLAQSQVMSIYQDSSHYLWFGTASGVSRFNGTDFVNYAKINGIHGNMINSIFQDKTRMLFRTGIGISSLESNHITKLFVGTHPSWNSHMVRTNDDKLWLISGYKLFTLLKDKLTRVIVNQDNGKVQATTLDKDGNIYAAVYGDGIFCRIGDKWIKKVDFSNSYKNIAVMSILFDRFDNSKMYLLTLTKLYQVVDGAIRPVNNSLLDNFKGELMGLDQDKGGAIWVGSSIGAFYLGKNSSIHFTNLNGFTSNPVTAIYCDKEDIIWLATDGDGFYKFHGLNLVSYQTINGAPLPLVTGIAQDKFNNLWVGTYGDGLIKIKNNQLTSIFLPSADPTSRIITCTGYKENQAILIGTAGGVWALNGKGFSVIDKQFVQRVNTISYDADNKIWVGTGLGCYYLKNGHFILVNGSPPGITTLCPIAKDSILAGTFFGLKLIVKGKIDERFEFKQIKGSAILAILKVNNLLIAGTFGQGIYLIDIANQRVKNISSLNGLKSNDVYSLMATDDNTIWAGTGRGIDKFRVNEKSLSVNLIHDIIPNPVTEYNQGSILKLGNKIWFGTNKGIVAYDFSNNPGNHNPVLNIEGIDLINQSDQKDDNSLLLSNDPAQDFKARYSSNRIVILFKGIYFTDPDNLLYQYRLKGLESQFSEPAKTTSADYTSLKPGKYQFEVRAISALGTKSDVKSITIEIIPAFYQTTWFYILMFVLLVALIVLMQQYFIYRKKVQKTLIEKLKRDEQIKIREQTAEDFHDDIGNKLTRIAILADVIKKKALTESDDQKELIDQIKENANALYTDTKDILWALDPQSENLFEILSFIKNLAIDIFSHTDIDVAFNQFDFKQNKYELPLDFSRNISMIFREILHNVLKHAEASQVTINCFMKERKITIELIDNGKGFDTKNVSEGKGLNNIRARARRINAEIEIISAIGMGTHIKLHFNMNAG